MADTQVPFAGFRAFDRNSQTYIPFKTQSDAMLASLMLAYRLATPIWSLFLTLVKHPNFNPADITLSGPEDVIQTVADFQERCAAFRASGRHGFAGTFPTAILEHVVDILEQERKERLYLHRDSASPYMQSLRMDAVDRDLKSVSLVCRAWRRPAQRALGHILIFHNSRREHIVRAIESNLFGSRTRELVIFRKHRECPYMDVNTYVHEHGEKSMQLVEAMLNMIRNVRIVTLNTDWFEVPFRRFTEALCRLEYVEELRLIQGGDISQLLGTLCKNISRISKLKHLYLEYSGSGSVYSDYFSPSVLEGLTPSNSLEKLSLTVGNTSVTSLALIKWMTSPRPDGFCLKSLSLDLSSCFYDEMKCVEALAPSFPTLDSLHLAIAGLKDGLSSSIVSQCNNLRRLSLVVRHFFTNASLDRLPSTLREVFVDFSYDEETAKWDEWDDMVHKSVVERPCPQLQKFVLKILSCGQGVIRNEAPTVPSSSRFAKTKKICKEVGIECIVNILENGRL